MGGDPAAVFTRDKLILLSFLTGAHFVTHIMLVAYNAITVVVGEELEFVNYKQLLSLITFTGVIYGGGAILTGYFSDRYDPLKMLTLGLVLSTVASFGIAFSFAFWMMVPFFALLGAGLAFYHPAGLSYISKVFGPRHRGKALGINGIGGDAGWLVSPIATAAIAVAFGWRFAYLAWGFLGLVFIVFALVLFGTGGLGLRNRRGKENEQEGEEEHNGRMGRLDLAKLASEEDTGPTSAKDYRAGLKGLLSATVLVVILITVFRGFYFHGTTDTLPTFVQEEKGVELLFAGGLLSVLYLMGIIAEPLGGFLKDRYQARAPIVICSLLNAGSLVFLIFAEGALMLTLAAVSFGFAFFMLMAVINALIADVTPPQVRGTFYGMTFATRDGIGFLAPLMVGAIADVDSFTLAYWVLVVFAVITATTALALRKQRNAEG